VLCNEFIRTYVQCTDVMDLQEIYTVMEPAVKDTDV